MTRSVATRRERRIVSVDPAGWNFITDAMSRVLLPEGTYTLNPYVVVAGGTVGLAPIELTVGTGQRLDLGNCWPWWIMSLLETHSPGLTRARARRRRRRPGSGGWIVRPW